jgi:hypothetical protein
MLPAGWQQQARRIRLMPSFAVLGFRPHTYWTAVAAVAGTADAPEVLARRRLTFAGEAERFIYHQAAEGDWSQAPARIEAARVAVVANAAAEIRALIGELKAQQIAIRAAVVPAATAKLPARLDDILASHARIHSAEGSFSRDAIAEACRAAGLAVHREVERELPALAADLLGVGPPQLTARLKAMGATLGPPWSEDFKLCVMAAALHLASAPA